MLFDNFKEGEIREVVYFESNKEGVSEDRNFNFKNGNIIQLLEPFTLYSVCFYKEYDNMLSHEGVILPKGFTMRVENIMGFFNKTVSFNPLMKYNKKIETNLKTRKFKALFSNLHGMKFGVFKDDTIYTRKIKIHNLLYS
jgi:hypothetical protein